MLVWLDLICLMTIPEEWWYRSGIKWDLTLGVELVFGLGSQGPSVKGQGCRVQYPESTVKGQSSRVKSEEKKVKGEGYCVRLGF